MFYLTKQQAEELIRHALSESPNEACGILSGKDGRVSKIYRMVNTDKSVKTFFMNPKEQFKVMKEIRNDDLEMVGIYHSHPQSEAYPSIHDVKLAFYPEVTHLIVSLKDKPSIRAFRIIDDKITEEEVKIK
ncbi:MAG: M67 family metallopeptidase [bacterium]